MGNINKSAEVKKLEINESEMQLINQYTLKELKSDDVFVFKLAMCDNAVDRQYEKFSDECLKELADLYVGKTVITNHERKAENQVARIYNTEVVDGVAGYKQLIGHCYMVKSEANKSLIGDIEAGIKKECSVGFRVSSAICSICGIDNGKEYCSHRSGKEYNSIKCYFTLSNAVDAYEVSLVPVPAQPKAGTVKSYHDDEPETSEKQQKNTEEEDITAEAESAKMLEAETNVIASFLFVENN